MLTYSKANYVSLVDVVKFEIWTHNRWYWIILWVRVLFLRYELWIFYFEILWFYVLSSSVTLSTLHAFKFVNFCKQLSRSSRPKFCDIVRQKELHHRDEEDKSESSEYSYYRQQGHLLTRWRKHSNARCVVVLHLI